MIRDYDEDELSLDRVFSLYPGQTQQFWRFFAPVRGTPRQGVNPYWIPEFVVRTVCRCTHSVEAHERLDKNRWRPCQVAGCPCWKFRLVGESPVATFAAGMYDPTVEKEHRCPRPNLRGIARERQP